MKQVEGKVRTIHPEIIRELGVKVAVELVKVGQDLRSGVIPRENFDMKDIEYFNSTCGTVCCIAGWVAHRMKVRYRYIFMNSQGDWIYGKDKEPRLARLINGSNPSDPILAADAIERYVYDYAKDPWGGCLAGYSSGR